MRRRRQKDKQFRSNTDTMVARISRPSHRQRIVTATQPEVDFCRYNLKKFECRRKANTTCDDVGHACYADAPAYRSSDRLQVNRGSFATFHGDVEGHLLAFVEATQTRGLHGGDVHEHVFSTILWNDEAISFGGIEPLHGASSHNLVVAPKFR